VLTMCDRDLELTVAPMLYSVKAIDTNWLPLPPPREES
jgi:hypothetical protein